MGLPTNGLTDLMRESMSVSLMAIGLKQSGLLPPFKECKLRKDRGQRNETIPILIKTPIIGIGGEGDTESLNAAQGAMEWGPCHKVRIRS